MSTEARSGLGWRSGTTRLTMKEELTLLQSFDPAERARGGHELVAAGLARSADALLDHVDNEYDDRVLAAIAQAVAATPSDAKESRRVADLRAWATGQLERQALEEAFLGREPQPVEVPPATPPLGPPMVEATRRPHISWRPPNDAAGAPAPPIRWGAGGPTPHRDGVVTPAVAVTSA